MRVSSSIQTPVKVMILALLVVTGCAGAAVDKVTSSTMLPLDTPSRAYPVETLLDVEIGRAHV